MKLAKVAFFCFLILLISGGVLAATTCFFQPKEAEEGAKKECEIKCLSVNEKCFALCVHQRLFPYGEERHVCVGDLTMEDFA
jgi:hypothetical protein